MVCHAFVVIVLSDEPRQNQGRALVDRKLVEAPSNFISGRSKAGYFGSLVILDVVCRFYRYSCYT